MSTKRTFTFADEDHTLGVLLRTQLLEDPNVIFAAYKVPHPMTRSFELCIHTVDTETVENALSKAFDVLLTQTTQLENSYSAKMII